MRSFQLLSCPGCSAARRLRGAVRCRAGAVPSATFGTVPALRSSVKNAASRPGHALAMRYNTVRTHTETDRNDHGNQKSRAGDRRRARHRARRREKISRRGLVRGAARYRGRIAARRGGGAGRCGQYAGAAMRRLRCRPGGRRDVGGEHPLRPARRAGQQCRRCGVRAAAGDLATRTGTGCWRSISPGPSSAPRPRRR